MELIACSADHLMGTREENHRHLLGEAHDTLPFTFHPSCLRVVVQIFNYFGDIWHLGPLLIQIIFDVCHFAGIAAINTPSKGCNLWRIALESQLGDFFIEILNIIFELLQIAFCFQFNLILLGFCWSLKLFPFFSYWSCLLKKFFFWFLLLLPSSLRYFFSPFQWEEAQK